MYNIIQNLIILLFGIIILSIGIWEVDVTIDTIHTNNKSVHDFILCKSIFNIISGFVYILISIVAMRYDFVRMPLLYLINILNCGINIWGLYKYYHENNIIKLFQEVLFVEMILFYTYLSIYLIPACILCILCNSIVFDTYDSETLKPLEVDNIDNVV